METTWFSYLWMMIVVYIITSYIKLKLQNLPPSPFWCFPVLGHFYVMKPPFINTLAKLSERYGPVMSFRIGWRRILLISSPSAAEECLTKNDVVFCNRPLGTIVGRIMGYNYTTINFAPYGPHWHNLRQVASLELLSSQRLGLLAGIRADEVRLLIQRLYNKAKHADDANDYQVLEMKSQLFDTTFNVITRMIFGKRYYSVEDEDAKRFREMVAKTVEVLNMEVIGDYVPYLRCLYWGTERRCRKFAEEREILLTEMIKNHRRELELISKQDSSFNQKKVVKPMVQVLLELQQSDPEYYKDEIIIGLISDLMTGGSDTSAGTMEWALSLLLNHPEVVKKAQEEIDKHVGYDRLIEDSDLNHLPYLQCIIKETLRMCPTAPFLVPHESSDDCVVGGYCIPRGTMLMINIWAIQNDPTIWEDPTSFRPDRFLGVKGHKIGFKMMPFGSGRRICPGEALAIRIVGLTIGSLIQCFDWNRIDDKMVDMTISPTFNLQRAEPLRAKLRPRPFTIKLFDC